MVKIESSNLSDVQHALRNFLESVPFVDIKDMQIEPVGYNVGPDIIAHLEVPDGEIVLLVEYRNNGQPRIAREAVDQIKRMRLMFPRAYGVFAAPYISPQSAEICSESQVGYLDLAGNCRLSFWPFHIERQGRASLPAEKRQLKSLYSPKATRILRVMLVNSHRTWKMQEMANEADVSIGQVANVKNLLEDREWVTADADGFHLIDPATLLAEWARSYSYRRNRTIDFYSVKSASQVESDLARICGARNIGYALTGFSASERYAPAARNQRMMAYVQEPAIPGIARELGLKEVVSGANVTLLIPYDEGVFYGASNIDGVSVVSPIQACLDLLGTKGRGEEAAVALFKAAIQPKWAAAKQTTQSDKSGLQSP